MGLAWVGYSNCVENYVINKLHECDMLLAYINATDAYGTIAEIAYMSALQKPCLIVTGIDIRGGKTTIDGEMSEAHRKATDAYWLVCSFPRVTTICEKELIDGSSTLEDIMADKKW